MEIHSRRTSALTWPGEPGRNTDSLIRRDGLETQGAARSRGAMADLDQHIREFQNHLTQRLDSIGYSVLNESRAGADFDRRFRDQFDEAVSGILDELC